MLCDDLAAVVCAIDAADLTATAYRTAVRLALRADDDRQLSLSHDELLELVGTQSAGTARSHLISLQNAGLIWYRRAATVQVVFAQRSERALSDQNARSAITSTDTQRALSDQNARSAIILQRGRDAERALSDQNARSTIKARAERSERALSARPITTNNIHVGREVGRYSNKNLPTYLPANPEQARTYRLLTDAEVGMDEPTAAKLSGEYVFEQVLANVMAVLAEIKSGGAGAPRTIYVLPQRLLRRGTPRLTDADRASELYRRHVPAEQEQEREEADLRNRYIPPEFADVIIG